MIGAALRETGSVSVHELIKTIEVITMLDQPDFGQKFGYGATPELQEYMGRASAALKKAQG